MKLYFKPEQTADKRNYHVVRKARSGKLERYQLPQEGIYTVTEMTAIVDTVPGEWLELDPRDTAFIFGLRQHCPRPVKAMPNTGIVYDGDTPHIRVTKAVARKLWNAGKPIVFCPVKLRPFGGWRPSVMLQSSPQGWTDFDTAVKNFEWYNCQLNETGYYTAFYVPKE